MNETNNQANDCALVSNNSGRFNKTWHSVDGINDLQLVLLVVLSEN